MAAQKIQPSQDLITAHINSLPYLVAINLALFSDVEHCKLISQLLSTNYEYTHIILCSTRHPGIEYVCNYTQKLIINLLKSQH